MPIAVKNRRPSPLEKTRQLSTFTNPAGEIVGASFGDERDPAPQIGGVYRECPARLKRFGRRCPVDHYPAYYVTGCRCYDCQFYRSHCRRISFLRWCDRLEPIANIRSTVYDCGDFERMRSRAEEITEESIDSEPHEQNQIFADMALDRRSLVAFINAHVDQPLTNEQANQFTFDQLDAMAARVERWIESHYQPDAMPDALP